MQKAIWLANVLKDPSHFLAVHLLLPGPGVLLGFKNPIILCRFSKGHAARQVSERRGVGP